MTALLIGLAAFVFIELLCVPFEVFGWWPPLLRRFLFGTDAIVDFEQMKWWQLAIYKPLAGCGKCCAGWLAVVYFINFEPLPLSNIFAFVTVAIFSAWLLEKLKMKIEA